MERLPRDYSRFNDLAKRTRGFLVDYPYTPLPNRHSTAALLFAQHCDKAGASELLGRLKEGVRAIYQSETANRREVEELKMSYWQELERISVWPGEFSGKMLSERFPREWKRGKGIALEFIRNLDGALIELTRTESIDNRLSLKLYGRLISRLDLRSTQPHSSFLPTLFRDIRGETELDSWIVRALVLERIWESIVTKIDDIFVGVLKQYSRSDIKITVTDPKKAYFSRLRKMAPLSAASLELREKTLRILRRVYQDEERREKAEVILRAILYINTERVSRVQRASIRMNLVRFLREGKIEEGIRFLQELFEEDPFIFPVAGGLALGFTREEIEKMQKEYPKKIAVREKEGAQAKEEERRRKEEARRKRVIEAALRRNSKRWELVKWIKTLHGRKFIDEQGRVMTIGEVVEVRSFMASDALDGLPDEKRISPGVIVYISYGKHQAHAVYCPLTIQERVENGEWRKASN